MRTRLLSVGTWVCGKTIVPEGLTGPQLSFNFTVRGGKFGGNRMKVAEKRGTARYNIGNRLPGCYPDTREERSYYEPAAR